MRTQICLLLGHSYASFHSTRDKFERSIVMQTEHKLKLIGVEALATDAVQRRLRQLPKRFL